MGIYDQSEVCYPYSENSAIAVVPASFTLVLERLFNPAGYTVENIEHEIEGAEYEALKFKLNGQTVLYRQAKTTPKKMGHFVTIWKRETPSSEISPFDLNDELDWVIIAVNNGTNFGVFVFSANLLAKKDVFSKSTKGGKRGIRVYAPWTTPTAAQAKRTKKWQTENFLNFNNCEDILNSFIRMFS